MSFVRLESGEFPPLDKAAQISQKSSKKAVKNNSHQTHNDNTKLPVLGLNDHKPQTDQPIGSTSNQDAEYKIELTPDSCEVFHSNVGVKLNNYSEDLHSILESNQSGDFLLAPIQPIRASFYNEKAQLLPDLALPNELWQTRIAIDIGYPITEFYDKNSASHFDLLLGHAFYLSVPVILIHCPDLETGCLTVASAINARLGEVRHLPAILFRFPIKSDPDTPNSSWYNIGVEKAPLTSSPSKLSESQSSSESGYDVNTSPAKAPTIISKNSAWHQWNALRSHLKPDPNIGLCLVINDDLVENDNNIDRWLGEPVRMIVIQEDQFVNPPGIKTSPKLSQKCEKFIEKLILANSLKTSFVFEGKSGHNVEPYVAYLKSFVQTVASQNPDGLRDWNERIQPPLQPLSSNLDSNTYDVFEMDKAKYTQYRLAVILALKSLVSKSVSSDGERHIIMVLGAGRGPIADECIEAIKSLGSKSAKFKLYALDKNPSAISSLMYKKRRSWANLPNIQTEVVQCDMRTWEPAEKADLIVTELLGSFSDNELSPECIDGVWRFAKPTSISIPQEYSSYIAPISSYSLHQQCYKVKVQHERSAYDQVYVAKLSNYYQISQPQELFSFRHDHLDWGPETRCNERYKKLTFWPEVETVCHGFAGYFKARLFGDVMLSTLIGNATPNMNSWFPAFIPLEQPVTLQRQSLMDLHFWRKESSSKVWYEWVVTNPVRSRIHSQNGVGTAMSKII